MYSTIVVGYDESESSKAALKEASLRVKEKNGKLYLVHAVYFDQEEFAILPSQMEQRFAAGTHVCKLAKQDLQAQFGLNGSVESFVCEGEPPEVLVEIAQGKKADLIALGTYGRKGLKRLLMGSVTSQVILNAPVMCWSSSDRARNARGAISRCSCLMTARSSVRRRCGGQARWQKRTMGRLRCCM
jgi:nucleotide-binding universal stress UspA family protein